MNEKKIERIVRKVVAGVLVQIEEQILHNKEQEKQEHLCCFGRYGDEQCQCGKVRISCYGSL